MLPHLRPPEDCREMCLFLEGRLEDMEEIAESLQFMLPNVL